MKTKLAIVLFLLTTTAQAATPGFDAMFAEFPIVGEAEIVDAAEFPAIWTDADYAQEPILLMTSAARAAAAPAELPIDNDGGFCRGNARIEDAQRDAEVKRYTREVLKAANVKDPGDRIEDCMARYARTLTDASRLNCLGLAEPEGHDMIDGFKQSVTQALELCVTVSPISDKQIKSALAELLRAE